MMMRCLCLNSAEGKTIAEYRSSVADCGRSALYEPPNVIHLSL